MLQALKVFCDFWGWDRKFIFPQNRRHPEQNHTELPPTHVVMKTRTLCYCSNHTLAHMKEYTHSILVFHWTDHDDDWYNWGEISTVTLVPLIITFSHTALRYDYKIPINAPSVGLYMYSDLIHEWVLCECFIVRLCELDTLGFVYRRCKSKVQCGRF